MPLSFWSINTRGSPSASHFIFIFMLHLQTWLCGFLSNAAVDFKVLMALANNIRKTVLLISKTKLACHMRHGQQQQQRQPITNQHVFVDDWFEHKPNEVLPESIWPRMPILMFNTRIEPSFSWVAVVVVVVSAMNGRFVVDSIELLYVLLRNVFKAIWIRRKLTEDA